jgi:hypothetical protein
VTTYYVAFHTPYCLTAGTLKSFIRWLVLSIRGNLDEYIPRHSVSVHMRTFMALWPRYAIISIPKNYRLQLLAFLASQELKDLAPISTRMRVKHVADVVDVKILTRAFWPTRNTFALIGCAFKWSPRLTCQLYPPNALVLLSS